MPVLFSRSVETDRRRRWAPRVIIEVAIASVGGALVVAALAANQSWLDRHFLPSFFVPRSWYVLIEALARMLIAIVGVVLAVGRTRVARVVTLAPAATLPALAAGFLAIGASEFALRSIHLRPT